MWDEHPVSKIAVLRANSLGDLIFVLPALEALRSRFPEAEVVLLARHWHQAFLAGRHSPIDRVIPIPGIPGIDASIDEERLGEFYEAMRAEHFDLALQLHGGGRNTNPLVKQVGARTTVGLQSRDAPPLDLVVPYFYYQNEIMRYLEVVGLVGAVPGEVQPKLDATDDDRRQAAELLGAVAARDYVVLHPGATDARRRWPAQSFARVASELGRAGLEVVIVGDVDEQPLAKEVAGSAGAPVLDLTGQTSLEALVGVLEGCALAVCNDSGPLHLAAALHRPVVAIFWCGNLINGGHQTRSRFRPCISWRVHCPVCGANCTEEDCEHEETFVADVPEDEVIEQALSLLSSRGGRIRTAGLGVPNAAR